MENLFYYKDLHDPIEGVIAQPDKMSDREWEKLKRKIIGLIQQWIDDNVFHHASMEVNAHNLWLKLKSLYGRKMVQNKVFLIRKLMNMKYKDGTSMVEHLRNF